MGDKQAKEGEGCSPPESVIFKTYSLGVKTNRDGWAYNFNRNALTKNMSRMIDNYNAEVDRWKRRENPKAKVDDFVDNDETKIKWSEGLKKKLKIGQLAEFAESKIRQVLYRPFTKSNLYFDRMMNERVYDFPSIFPTPKTETENRVICVGCYDRKAFAVLMSKSIPDVNFYGDPQQSFPLLYLQREGEKPTGEHHQLGVKKLPHPLPEMSKSPSGTSSITSTGYSTTRHTESGIRSTSSVIYRICRMRRTFGGLPKRVSSWGRFMSVMRM